MKNYYFLLFVTIFNILFLYIYAFEEVQSKLAEQGIKVLSPEEKKNIKAGEEKLKEQRRELEDIEKKLYELKTKEHELKTKEIEAKQQGKKIEPIGEFPEQEIPIIEQRKAALEKQIQETENMLVKYREKLSGSLELPSTELMQTPESLKKEQPFQKNEKIPELYNDQDAEFLQKRIDLNKKILIDIGNKLEPKALKKIPESARKPTEEFLENQKKIIAEKIKDAESKIEEYQQFKKKYGKSPLQIQQEFEKATEFLKNLATQLPKEEDVKKLSQQEQETVANKIGKGLTDFGNALKTTFDKIRLKVMLAILDAFAKAVKPFAQVRETMHNEDLAKDLRRSKGILAHDLFDKFTKKFEGTEPAFRLRSSGQTVIGADQLFRAIGIDKNAADIEMDDVKGALQSLNNLSAKHPNDENYKKLIILTESLLLNEEGFKLYKAFVLDCQKVKITLKTPIQNSITKDALTNDKVKEFLENKEDIKSQTQSLKLPEEEQKGTLETNTPGIMDRIASMRKEIETKLGEAVEGAAKSAAVKEQAPPE